MEKYWMWIVLALVAVYVLFLRKSTTITGGANLGIATGNNASPYPGYAPGQYPPGVSPSGGYSGASPPPPQPVYNVNNAAQGDSTGGILAGVGGLIGGIGSGLGSVFTGLGNSGLLSSSGSSGGSTYSSDGDWTGDW